MHSIGADIEEVTRFSRLLHVKPQLLQKIFTPYEWEYSKSKYQSQTLAGIWCAKESVVKAMSELNIVLNMQDVCIAHKQNGVPFVEKITNMNDINEFDIKISISHTKNYATAVCLIIITKQNH
jgi:holo-[acyl-carrier protein] synthase